MPDKGLKIVVKRPTPQDRKLYEDLRVRFEQFRRDTILAAGVIRVLWSFPRPHRLPAFGWSRLSTSRYFRLLSHLLRWSLLLFIQSSGAEVEVNLPRRV